MSTILPEPPPRPLYIRFRMLAVAMVVALFAMVGCTAAERSIVGGVINDVGTATSVACAFVPSTEATVCAQDAGVISSVSKLVATVLSNLPAAAKRAAAATAGQPPLCVAWGGALVWLPPGYDRDQIVAGLNAAKAGK